MTSRFFPSRIRTVDDAIDYLPLWVETIGGEQRDGLNVRELSDIRDQIIEIHVKRFHVDFPALGTVLTVGIQFDSDLEATWYTFDLRTIGGVLLWREDSHPGHEAEDGGSHRPKITVQLGLDGVEDARHGLPGRYVVEVEHWYSCTGCKYYIGRPYFATFVSASDQIGADGARPVQRKTSAGAGDHQVSERREGGPGRHIGQVGQHATGGVGVVLQGRARLGQRR